MAAAREGAAGEGRAQAGAGRAPPIQEPAQAVNIGMLGRLPADCTPAVFLMFCYGHVEEITWPQVHVFSQERSPAERVELFGHFSAALRSRVGDLEARIAAREAHHAALAAQVPPGRPNPEQKAELQAWRQRVIRLMGFRREAKAQAAVLRNTEKEKDLRSIREAMQGIAGLERPPRNEGESMFKRQARFFKRIFPAAPTLPAITATFQTTIGEHGFEIPEAAKISKALKGWDLFDPHLLDAMSLSGQNIAQMRWWVTVIAAALDCASRPLHAQMVIDPEAVPQGPPRIQQHQASSLRELWDRSSPHAMFRTTGPIMLHLSRAQTQQALLPDGGSFGQHFLLLWTQQLQRSLQKVHTVFLSAHRWNPGLDTAELSAQIERDWDQAHLIDLAWARLRAETTIPVRGPEKSAKPGRLTQKATTLGELVPEFKGWKSADYKDNLRKAELPEHACVRYAVHPELCQKTVGPKHLHVEFSQEQWKTMGVPMARIQAARSHYK